MSETRVLAMVAVLAGAATAACSSSTGGSGTDAAPPDAQPDTGTTADASKADAHASDAGSPDTGSADAGSPDTGAADAPATDAPVVDTGTADSGTGDAATTDAAPADGATDGGYPTCTSSWLTPPTLGVDAGANLDVPLPDSGPALTVLLHGQASGTQDYTCTGGDGGTYSWVFTGPEAKLDDCNGTFVVEHTVSSAGTTRPQWASQLDTSVVVGAKLQAYTASATAIPWLLLQAVSSSGTGLLTTVQYIQRLNTTGGVAPTTTCDATNVGTTDKVPYTADYYFYGP